MLHIILLTLSFFCISNIQAAQESKAMAEDRTEVAIPAASAPTASRTSTPRTPEIKPWQTFAHSKLPAVLWPIIFNYAGEKRGEIRAVWKIEQKFSDPDRIDDAVAPKNGNCVYTRERDRKLSRRNITTGLPDATSSISGGSNFYPLDNGIVVQHNLEDNYLASILFYQEEQRYKRGPAYKQFEPIAIFKNKLLIKGIDGTIEQRCPLTFKVEKIFIPATEAFVINNEAKKIYTVNDRFIFTVAGNKLSIFKNSKKHVIHPTYVFSWQTKENAEKQYDYYFEKITKISHNKFAVHTFWSEDIKILDTTHQTVSLIPHSERITVIEKAGENRLLIGDYRGSITDLTLHEDRDPDRGHFVHEADCLDEIRDLRKINDNRLISMNQRSMKIWKLENGECLHTFNNFQFRLGWGGKFDRIPAGYIMHDNRNQRTHRVTWKDPLQFAYEDESTKSEDKRKVELTKKSDTSKKITLVTQSPTSPSPMQPRRRSLSPARPATAAAAAAYSGSAAAGIAPAIKKIAVKITVYNNDNEET